MGIHPSPGDHVVATNDSGAVTSGRVCSESDAPTVRILRDADGGIFYLTDAWTVVAVEFMVGDPCRTCFGSGNGWSRAARVGTRASSHKCLYCGGSGRSAEPQR